MKKLVMCRVFVLSLVLTCSVAVFAQLQYVPSPSLEKATPDQSAMEAQFKSIQGVVDVSTPRARDMAVRRSLTADKVGSEDPFGPGDHPLFLLDSNHEFIQEKENLELSFLPIVTSHRSYSGSIQILRPGDDGQYDGTFPVSYVPFTTKNGMIENPNAGVSIPIFSRVFNSEDRSGRWTFNIVTWDERNNLAQQIIFDVYMDDAGRWGRFFYIDKANPNSTGVVLRGRFPTATPIYYAVKTSRGGGFFIGPDPHFAAFSNGTNLTVPGAMSFNRTTTVHILLWAPGSRYAFVKPNAYAEEVQPQ